ncbi:hypothetical protein D3C76_1507770 [compost metagenome]
MAGLDVSAWRHDGAGIKRNEVADANAKLQHVFFILYDLVDPYLHVLLLAFELAGVAVDVNGRVGRQDRAGIYPAAAGVDLAVFVFDAVHHEPANRGDRQRAVRTDGAHHSA